MRSPTAKKKCDRNKPDGVELSNLQKTVIPENVKDYSLLASVLINLDTNSESLMGMTGNESSVSIYSDDVRLPKKETQDDASLRRPVAIFGVLAAEYAHSIHFRDAVENEDISLIQGLPEVLGMNMSMFSPDGLRKTAPRQSCEIRRQYWMPYDKNLKGYGEPNTTWSFYSAKSRTKIGDYAKYMEKHKISKETFCGSTRYHSRENDEKLYEQTGTEEWREVRQVEFATNIDLDGSKWSRHLKELQKLPSFLRVDDPRNILSHIGYTIPGMSAVQMYMKVGGVVTPAHQENNSAGSVNLNVGPDECSWFGVSKDYFEEVNKICEEKGINIRTDSFLPVADELRERNIPVTEFKQGANELVYVGFGCIHWVRSEGYCTNVSWNVAPMKVAQLKEMFFSYEYNKAKKYKSLVPIKNLLWKLAETSIQEEEVFNEMRSQLILSLAHQKRTLSFLDEMRMKPILIRKQQGDQDHYCWDCEEELFNLILVNRNHEPFCFKCVNPSDLDGYDVRIEKPFAELLKIYDSMKFQTVS